MRGREIGDLLVKDERRLKPSLAFRYLVLGEIEPGAYPEFAVRQFRAEFRRTCDHRLASCGRWDLLRNAPMQLAIATTGQLIRLVLIGHRIRTVSTEVPWEGVANPAPAPRAIAALRSFG